uniref:Uncharacterized protein n=1 Tax=Romanomermis culicivorax TaxID=13658 RepID=A0A915KEM1_ROMCU
MEIVERTIKSAEIVFFQLVPLTATVNSRKKGIQKKEIRKRNENVEEEIFRIKSKYGGNLESSEVVIVTATVNLRKKFEHSTDFRKV